MIVDRNANDSLRLRRNAQKTSVTGIHSHVFGEVPSGVVGGGNAVFGLVDVPALNSLMLFKNGMLQRAGTGYDYVLVSKTITFEAGNLPQTGDTLLAAYISS